MSKYCIPAEGHKCNNLKVEEKHPDKIFSRHKYIDVKMVDSKKTIVDYESLVRADLGNLICAMAGFGDHYTNYNLYALSEFIDSIIKEW